METSRRCCASHQLPSSSPGKDFTDHYSCVHLVSSLTRSLGRYHSFVHRTCCTPPTLDPSSKVVSSPVCVYADMMPLALVVQSLDPTVSRPPCVLFSWLSHAFVASLFPACSGGFVTLSMLTCPGLWSLLVSSTRSAFKGMSMTSAPSSPWSAQACLQTTPFSLACFVVANQMHMNLRIARCPAHKWSRFQDQLCMLEWIMMPS